MQRTLRQSGKNVKNEEKLNSEQKKQYEMLKNTAKRYEGKSENEILEELSKTVSKGKKDGSITDEKIKGIVNTVAPLLDGEQKKRLDIIVNSLKNI